jgi:hypothetical protein
MIWCEMGRYDFCWDKTVLGSLEKLPRGRFTYRKFFDNVAHVCREGDTLWGISAQYYNEQFDRPELLYWIVADFQPIPIVDPTIAFSAGDVVQVPSVRVVKLYLEDPAREPEFEAW